MSFLNYHHLRYFWAIANEGGLTRAAKLLNVSPSSLSVQLKALEEQLGQPLFERDGRSLRLTEAGRIAFDYAKIVFKSGDELLSTFKNLSLGHRRMRIGSVATLSRNFQIEFLKPLIDRKDVELVVKSGAFGELLNLLETHVLDLVLANQPATMDLNSEWQNLLIAEQPVSIIGHPELLKKARGKGEIFNFPNDLTRVPIVLPGRGEAIRMAFDRIIEEAGIEPIVLAEVDDMAMLRLIVRESHSVTLAPPVVVKDELASGALVELVRIEQIKESFYAITRNSRFENPLLTELLGAERRRSSMK
ncbi:LysR family transcriptional regulator [Methylocystis sp. WRRC1]|uniref:LysR family transcriptional regulator n=1 Tax=Methylocystis sp. WRRC1 TaxID=1732014 RepID=UPI001D14C7D2|nr:LysR family transcriptional regulator [Methylocystis sp. WRRC1]MCC3245397.1 LysR family transcriptional regulator [Methylocystis sp. WRRC1]